MIRKFRHTVRHRRRFFRLYPRCCVVHLSNYKKKHLLEQKEETSHLKNLNKNLLEQIRDLKDEKLKIQSIENKVDTSKIKELLRLRNHNQSLLTQINKLKDDKKALKDKLEQLTQEEISKSPVVTVQVEDKGTNTNQ